MNRPEPATTVTTVLLVDDQALFRGGIAMLVDSQPDLRVVGEAADGGEVLGAVGRTRPQVVLMDVRMPGVDGIEATRRIVDAYGDAAPRVIVLTTFDFDEAAADAIAAGASGFLLKDAEPEFLLASIRAVASGSQVIAAKATRALFERFRRRSASGPGREYERLTEREREMLVLAAEGLSNAEIAARERLSEATVKTHVSRILAKLGLRDRVQLVVYAYEHGLV
ncbi:MAG TPA: response regulator transcription factor [Rugosimonospora sp.]|nr:response regulator transcription factor [Rugosimonospora sp.]